MSYDEMKHLWKSPENQPTREATDRQRDELVASLRRQHRGFYVRVGLAIALMLAPLVVMVVNLMRGDTFPFAPSREWAVLVLIMLPWIAGFLFIRRQRRHLREHAGYGRSVGQTLRAMRDANRAAQHRARVLQVLLALSAPVLAASIWQLHDVGKARPHEAASLAAFMAIVIVASLAGITWHARALRPRERRLAELLAELE